MNSGKMKFTRPLWAFFIGTFLCCLLCACSNKDDATVTASPSVEVAEQADYDGLVISEFMTENSAILCREGDFPDWIELYNESSSPISLEGCTLGDGQHTYTFGAVEIAGGGYLLLYAGKGEGDLGFALSETDCLTLSAPDGTVLSSCSCEECKENCSMVLCADGSYALTSRSTPGYANTDEGYEAYQRSLPSPEGLRINEVYAHGSSDLGTTDWVELMNAGNTAISLEDYALSDRIDELSKLSLPSLILQPGEIYLCELGDESFSLNSDTESVYLSCKGELMDFLCLRNIPTAGTLGRQEGGGWYVYGDGSPESENAGGYRLVAESPTLQGQDGVFAPGESVEVTLCAKGTIHYTTDCSLPDENSPVYTESLILDKDTVIRAISLEEGKLTGDAVTYSFYFTDVTLPVVSLVGDTPQQLERMKKLFRREDEVVGALSYYSEDVSFTIPCGVNLSGNYSMSVAQKSFKVSFRSCYGADALRCDLFGTGVDEYHSLGLKKGADSTAGVITNELFESLALSFTDRCAVKHSQFCRMYINGSYWGLVSLKEDFSRSYFAAVSGDDKDEVDYFKFPARNNSDFYKTVMPLCKGTAAFSDEEYAQLCSLVDIDSLIDWMIIKGYSGDIDFYPNLACYRSPATDMRWRFALWDFDWAFSSPFSNMVNSTHEEYFSLDLKLILKPLLGNAQFRQRFLDRFAEAMNGVLSEENVLAVLHQYRDLVSAEVEIDWPQWGKHSSNWEKRIAHYEELIESGSWRESVILGVERLPYMNKMDVRGALEK